MVKRFLHTRSPGKCETSHIKASRKICGTRLPYPPPTPTQCIIIGRKLQLLASSWGGKEKTETYSHCAGFLRRCLRDEVSVSPVSENLQDTVYSRRLRAAEEKKRGREGERERTGWHLLFQKIHSMTDRGVQQSGRSLKQGKRRVKYASNIPALQGAA